MICLLAGVVPANRPHYYQAELNIGWLFLTASSFGNVKLVVIEQCLPASSKSPTWALLAKVAIFGPKKMALRVAKSKF